MTNFTGFKQIDASGIYLLLKVLKDIRIIVDHKYTFHKGSALYGPDWYFSFKVR